MIRMCDKAEFEICRLCLNSGGMLINVFDENSKLEFMLEKTIEELIDVEVVEDDNYPWLVCSNCMEKLTEFRLFKRRCSECVSVFYNRVQRGCNHATKEWITNRDEFPVEIKSELCDDPIVSDITDERAVGEPDNMIIVKEEIDAASESSVSPVKDIDSLMVVSMQEGCSHWSDNEEERNLDHLQDDKLHLSLNEEVIIKEEWDVDIPREGEGLGADMLQGQDDDQGQDEAEKEEGQGQGGAGSLVHKCQICDITFKEEELLKAHVGCAHLENEGQFGCDVCPNVFECKSDLNDHVKSVHAVGRVYQCKQCSVHFENRIELKIHLSTHSSERPFKCELCHRAYTYKKSLRRHILSHSGEKAHACEICLKAYSSKSHLTRHMWTYHGKRWYKCDICHQEFSQGGDLKEHKSTHAVGKSCKCEICLKTYSSNVALKRHMLTHTGEKSYKCSTCSRAFSQKEALKRHMSTHTGEKSHKCHICARAFNRNGNLKSHMITHTGERRHRCEVCAKSFTQKSTLKKHMLAHTMKNQANVHYVQKHLIANNTFENHS